MEKPRRKVAIVMQRRATQNRWQSEIWEPWSVMESDNATGPPRLLMEDAGLAQWLHPGFELVLHRDEAEGYYLNVTSGKPSVFVLWREDDGVGIPLQVTASYSEGARWLDGGHSVDHVVMPVELFAWLGAYVEANYRPEPRKRIKPRSFMHPKDRSAQ